MGREEAALLRQGGAPNVKDATTAAAAAAVAAAVVKLGIAEGTAAAALLANTGGPPPTVPPTSQRNRRRVTPLPPADGGGDSIARGAGTGPGEAGAAPGGISRMEGGASTPNSGDGGGLAHAVGTSFSTAPSISPPGLAVQPHKPTQQNVQESAHSGEVFLMEMLAAMDQHMQHLRETQQGLVATVELACRRALGHHFGRLVLVGSAALRVETPGSDVDVVCFTRSDGTEAVGLPVDVLRRVHLALWALVSQYADHGANFSMELIDDARVPILRVLWGSSTAVDVSVDQNRPVDHVRWFQRVGAAPRPTAPPPAVAPLVTLTLRCVKWWLRQRQVPRTKEGGLPTLAWLLMAVHVCSLPETHEQAIISGQRPMVALLASLAAFFHHYATLDGLDGALIFAADGSSSEFRRRGEKKRGGGPFWAELSVLDPTREGAESLDLAPRLHPATQLLLAHELRRASERLLRVPKGHEAVYGDGRRVLEEVFEPLPDGTNALPSFGEVHGMGALLLWGGSTSGGTHAGVELGIIDRIQPRPGWTAPFLHRADDRSELHARLYDVEDPTGRCHPRKRSAAVVLCPCHFICRVHLEKETNNTKSWRLDSEGHDRYRAMKRYLSEMASRPQAAAAAAQSLAALPSPSRSRGTPI